MTASANHRAFLRTSCRVLSETAVISDFVRQIICKLIHDFTTLAHMVIKDSERPVDKTISRRQVKAFQKVLRTLLTLSITEVQNRAESKFSDYFLDLCYLYR